MKEAFLRCMRHLYPDPIIGDVMHPHQLRDLVRAFSMGWAEALAVTDGPRHRAWCKAHAYMADEDWFPDDSWKWWLPHNGGRPCPAA